MTSISALPAILVLARHPAALQVLGILVVIGSVLIAMCRPRIAPAFRRLTA